MNRLYSIMLIVVCLPMAFQQAVIILHFNLNQQVIEQQYCVNKNKPELQCRGKCQLIKQLQEKGDSNPESISYPKKFDIFSLSIFDFKVETCNFLLPEIPLTYLETEYTEPTIKIILPPPNPRLLS